MDLADLARRYRELQSYVGWTAADAARIVVAANYIRRHIPSLVDDFYDAILRHPRTAQVITGGEAQVQRLRLTLAGWIEQLLAGPYDEAYVARRALVGKRHVEIGLEQVYTAVALSRLRSLMTAILLEEWEGSFAERGLTIASLNRLLDLDLAIITATYEAEHVAREQAAIRDRLEAELQQEKVFSEGLLAHAQAIVLVLDLEGRILRFNPYLERLAGYRVEEVERRGWLEVFLAAEDRGRVLREVIDRARSAPPGLGLAGVALASLITRDHQWRTVRWLSTLLRDATGEPFAILVIGHDVTDLLAAQERALQAERLAAIGQVATGLAHEARNALQRIQASAEMLEMEVADRPEAQNYVRRIEQSQAHLQRLFDEVRGYAAPIHLDSTLCRISSLWREAWELLSPQRAGREAELCERGESCDRELVLDHFRMVQVFRNILENALAACHDPVRIEVACEDAELAGQPAVRIVVQDNGPGLTPEQRRRIFQPFYTTKPKGTGLGMAIVQRLVEAHGGTIEVGDCDRGCQLVITLPLAGRGDG